MPHTYDIQNIYQWSCCQERQSTETRIVVKSVSLASEGSYLCEVSGEAPLFQTAKNQNFLRVVGNDHSAASLEQWEAKNQNFLRVIMRSDTCLSPSDHLSSLIPLGVKSWTLCNAHFFTNEKPDPGHVTTLNQWESLILRGGTLQ